MIDRSYLPFQSAREYQDTGMQKWMGFFLSEHTSALSYDTNKVASLSHFKIEDKLLLLNQVYTGQLTTCIDTIKKNKCISYIGKVSHLTKDFVMIKTSDAHVTLKLNDILNISLISEVCHESS